MNDYKNGKLSANDVAYQAIIDLVSNIKYSSESHQFKLGLLDQLRTIANYIGSENRTQVITYDLDNPIVELSQDINDLMI